VKCAIRVSHVLWSCSLWPSSTPKCPALEVGKSLYTGQSVAAEPITARAIVMVPIPARRAQAPGVAAVVTKPLCGLDLWQALGMEATCQETTTSRATQPSPNQTAEQTKRDQEGLREWTITYQSRLIKGNSWLQFRAPLASETARPRVARPAEEHHRDAAVILAIFVWVSLSVISLNHLWRRYASYWTVP